MTPWFITRQNKSPRRGENALLKLVEVEGPPPLCTREETLDEKLAGDFLQVPRVSVTRVAQAPIATRA